MSNKYSLQLRHGAEDKNFSTRDEVIAYINGQLQYGANVSILPYEPILFFYGEDTAKNTIIMVGLPEGKTHDGKSYFLVDTANLQEQIDESASEADELTEKIEDEIAKREEADEALQGAIDAEVKTREDADKALEQTISDEAKAREDADAAEAEVREEKDAELENLVNFNAADIQSVIDACGLLYNEKLAEDRVSYEPDLHDEVIRDAKTVAEAIDKVSKFAAQLGESLNFAVEDTDTIDLTFEEDAKKGYSLLKADVNIAGSDGLSVKNFDNNIIGKTSDGLYAAASIEPSTKNPNILIFKTSGYVDGKFKVDAYETEVPLTAYKGDNGKNSGITVDVDADKNLISATLNLASDKTNLLKLEDGEYMVEGLAKNIKYKDTTVAQALNSHTSRLDDIEDAIDGVKAVDIKGSETITSTVSVEKSTKGDFTVANNVKLSSDNSIIIANGGLEANVTASVAQGTTILTINVGNHKYDIDLSELSVSFLESATYDAANEQIVLTFKVGTETRTLRVPVGTLIHDIEVDDTDTIDLALQTVTGGPNRISGEVRVDKTHSDNILTVTSNGLYVSKAYITNAVKEEAESRSEADDILKAEIEKVAELANVNKESISKEQTRAEKAEQANTDAITAEVSRAKEEETKNANAITSEINRATEKENDLLEKVGNNTSKIAKNKDAIDQEVKDARAAEKANAAAIATEEKRASLAEAANATAISKEELRATAAEGKNAASISEEVKRATKAEETLAASVATNAENIANVTSIANVNKSDLANEITRATAAEKANADSIAVNTGAITTMAAKVNDIDKSVTEEITRAKKAEEAIDTEKERAMTAEGVNASTIADEIVRAKESEKEITTIVATKADAASVYTKEEIVNLVEPYAKSADVQEKLNAKLNVADAENVYATKDALQSVKDGYATTDSVTALEVALGKRIDLNGTSIDNFDLTYNSATSELVYTDKNGVSKTYKLYSGSLVKSGKYENGNIVLEIETAGQASQITIPVSELVSDIDAKISINSNAIKDIENSMAKLSKSWDVSQTDTIELTKSTAGEKDSLSAKVKVASSNKQAIQSTGDGLYVSNDLEDFTVVYGDTGTISGQDAISKLLTSTSSFKDDIATNAKNISELTEKVATNSASITQFKTDIETAKSDISTLKTDVATYKSKVDSAVDKVDLYDSRISVVEGSIKTVQSTLNDVQLTVKTLQQTVGGYDTTITELRGLITSLTETIEKITGDTGDLATLKADISKLKTVTGSDDYTSEKTMSNRLDILENEGGSTIKDEIDKIENKLIGTKENPLEGSIWAEINNIVDAGTFE